MKVVHKFPVPLASTTSGIDMPRGSRLLHFDSQGSGLFIWALVDPNEAMDSRTFFVVGTGHTLPELHYRHVGSCMDGAFVWHLFEVMS